MSTKQTVALCLILILYSATFGHSLLSRLEKAYPPSTKDLAATIEYLEKELWRVEIDGVELRCTEQPKITSKVRLIGCDGLYGRGVVVKNYKLVTVERVE